MFSPGRDCSGTAVLRAIAEFREIKIQPSLERALTYKALPHA